MPLYFPAPEWDGTSITQGAPRFGANRGRRVHGACDLYAPLESDVVAVDAGHVVEISGPGFAGTTEAISLFHEGIGVIRYGEVVQIPDEFKTIGALVERGGIVIGKVGKAVRSYPPMLHFELFDGSGSGRLTVRDNDIEYYNEGVAPNGDYQRRSDLMNPTAFLQRLWLEGRR